MKTLSNLLKKKRTPKQYVFVGGCARSGTTSLTKIIGSHKKIVLGMERYNNYFNENNFLLTEEHFNKQRFFSVEKNDTFYDNFSDFHNWCPKIYNKYDKSLFIGTKYTDIHRFIDQLNASFNSPIIFYIYRDIFDVAESWNRRALRQNDGWPADKDYTQAILTWNESLAIIKKYKQVGLNIICVNFYDLFFTTKSIEQLFYQLDLKPDRGVKRMIKHLRNKAPIKKEKKGKLSNQEIDYISKNANIKLYDYFNIHYNILK